MAKKGAKPRLIWCVEDYLEFRRQFGELIPIWFPGVKFEAFASAMEMKRDAVGSPDIILLDVAGMSGGITPGSGVGIETFSHMAVGVIREHPGAIVGMYSAVGHWAEDIILDVKEAVPECVIEQFDGMEHADLKRFLEKHLNPESKC